MLFKKKSSRKKPEYPFPGTPSILDSYTALKNVQINFADAIVIPDYLATADWLLSSENGTASTLLEAKNIRKVTSIRDLVPTALGFALGGWRTALWIDRKHLSRIAANLREVARYPLPLVVYISASETDSARDLIATFSREDILSLSENFFVFHPRNLQELIDYSLISHRIAEQALVPGMVIGDPVYLWGTSQWLNLPEKEFLHQFLGNGREEIPTPTPAQELIFGKERQRIPRWMDMDRPISLGSSFDIEVAFKAQVGRVPYFRGHLNQIIHHTLKEYSKQTGRFYHPISAYQWENAEYGVITFGTLTGEVAAVVEYLRKIEKLPVGLLSLNIFSPFPEASLSHYLKGKKGITVLQQGMGGDEKSGLLGNRIRQVIQKALVNGITSGDNELSDFARIEKLKEIPTIFEGIYGPFPNPRDLIAVFKNMMNGGDRKKFFFVGSGFLQADMRFPILEMFQQRIRRNYPELDRLSLMGEKPPQLTLTDLHTIHLISADLSGNYHFGSLFAKALAGVLRWKLKARPGENNLRSIQPSEYHIQLAPDEEQLNSPSEGVDVLLITRYNFLREVVYLERMKQNGILLFPMEKNASTFWGNLTIAQRSLIEKRKLQIYTLDVQPLFSEIKGLRHNRETFRLLALIGAFLKIFPQVKGKNFQRIIRTIRAAFEERWGEKHPWVEAYVQALFRGSELYQKLEWQKLPPVEPKALVEPEVPWTVREVKKIDHTAFDITQTWETVGFLYESGRKRQALADPALTTGILPARSSAFRDLSTYRDTIPRVIPENCTTCGNCWTYCPDSAIPPVLQSIEYIFRTAVKICEERNIQFLHLNRILDHLIKQAHRIFKKDELHQYRCVSELVEAAFQQLMEKMSPTEDQKKDLQSEFTRFLEALGNFPIIRSQTFFDEAENRQSGSGKIVSLFINPQSCKECGICVQVCPEEALEMVEQTDDLLAEYHHAFQFYLKLPQIALTEIEPFISPEDPQTQAYYLFNRKIYYSQLGGDGAPAGSGIKTALHLMFSALEVEMQKRVNLLIQQLDRVTAQLEEKIQNAVSSSLKINDFEAFAHKLSRLEKDGVDLSTLANLISSEEEQPVIDKSQLERRTWLLNQLKSLKEKYVHASSGDGRARLVASVTADDLMLWPGRFPYNPYPFPWVFQLNEESAGTAEALFLGVMREMAETFKTIRTAQMEIDETYDAEEFEKRFSRFSWTDFTDEEWAVCPPVFFIGIARTQSTGIYEAALRSLKSGLPIKIAVLTVADPVPLETRGDSLGAVSAPSDWILPFIAGQNAFVLQSSAGLAGHLMSGVREGINLKGPSFFHIYATEPDLHDVLPAYGTEQAALAVTSRAFPVLKYNPLISETEIQPVNLEGNPEPGETWATVSVPFTDENGIEKSMKIKATFADWAVQEGRYKRHFRIISRAKWHANMLPLHEFLELAKDERLDIEPYIRVVNNDGSVLRIVVSPAIVRATENRALLWKRLQELAAIRPITGEMVDMKIREAIARAQEETRKAVEKEFQEKISRLESEHQQIYHTRIFQKLMALSGFAGSSESARQSLREMLSGLAKSNGNSNKVKEE